MNKPVLECNGIAAGYVKDLDILQGVDLVVNQNEIVSIIGPNGAGKSTLLKAIMGIINISAGRFYINGIEKTKTPTHKIVKEGVAYVPQVENVFPSLTIEENLEIGAWTIGNKEKTIIFDIFKQFSLLKDRRKDKAGNLSGGQRQILALARALVNKPKLVLADEPTGNLDSKNAKNAINLLCELCRETETALLVVSHDERVVSNFNRQVDWNEINNTDSEG